MKRKIEREVKMRGKTSSVPLSDVRLDEGMTIAERGGRNEEPAEKGRN